MKEKDHEIYKKIGKKLKMIRATNDLTLKDLGQILGVTGQQVQKYESGVSPISIEKITIISRKFRISINEFLR